VNALAACGHVAAAGPRCRCGHGVELHNLAGDDITRKACSISTGRDATPCGCNRYEPAVNV
jgi:hypothetical protein